MFDIGFWELGLIGLIALIVLGPERLPEAARTAGRWVGRLRHFISDVKQDLDRQLQTEELAELRRLKEELVQTKQAIEQSSNKLVSDLTESAAEEDTPEYLLNAIEDSPQQSKAKPKAGSEASPKSSRARTAKRGGRSGSHVQAKKAAKDSKSKSPNEGKASKAKSRVSKPK